MLSRFGSPSPWLEQSLPQSAYSRFRPIVDMQLLKDDPESILDGYGEGGCQKELTRYDPTPSYTSMASTTAGELHAARELLSRQSQTVPDDHQLHLPIGLLEAGVQTALDVLGAVLGYEHKRD